MTEEICEYLFSFLAVVQPTGSVMFDHLVSKYLLGTYYLLSTILGTGGYSRTPLLQKKKKILNSWNLAGDYDVFVQSFLPFVDKARLRFSADL